MKIRRKVHQPQAIQNVDEFYYYQKKFWRSLALSIAYQWIIYSDGAWEWYKYQNDLHHNSSSSINSLWSEKLHACKKQNQH